MMEIIETEDGLFTFFSVKYNQTYHSRHGLLQEAHHVFLEGSGVNRLLKTGDKLNILEIGFGTGFNFFLTAAEAQKNNRVIEYYAVEKDLPDYQDFKQLNHGKIFKDNPLWENFMSWRKNTVYLKTGEYRIDLGDIRLNLILLDALQITLPKDHFHAIYHDAFSPDKNPELWTVSFFRNIYDSMKTGSWLATYSAKGEVRRAMLAAGFSVAKTAGPKGKREMLLALKK